MAIKKWEDFKDLKNNKKSDKKDKNSEEGIETKKKEKDGLTDDITNIQDKINKPIKLEDGEYEIVSINDVSIDKPENVDEATIINADLSGKEVKRGDVLYITAMMQKKNANWNSMSVIKVRIIDLYKGLNILNTLR